jgi:hypothetical protein
MNTFHHFLPECVADFLDAREIVTFSSTSRSIREKLERQVNVHKQTRLEELFSYFDRQVSFHLEHSTRNSRRKIKYVLLYLPELFAYIEKKDIDYIDLGLTGYYDGYPSDISAYITDKSQLQTVTSQLLSCIKNNKTLKKCNLGLFEWQLERDTILEVFQRHPSLDWLTLRAMGSKTRFTDAPHTIYRKSNGEAVWSHFRP